MLVQRANGLREAIEDLMNVKLLDVLSQPDRLARLNAQRIGAGASARLRDAELRLEEALSATVVPKPRRGRQRPDVRSSANTDTRQPWRRTGWRQ
jgi:hypothetical protein